MMRFDLMRYVAVLGVPPINGAQDAVRVVAVAHIKKQNP
jgi:hypothetical protein